MELYAILRRTGWRSPAELQEAAARSTRVGNEDMPDEVRWIRSYVLDEGGGAVGTVCIYEATEPGGAAQARQARRPSRGRDHPDRRHRARAPRPGSRQRVVAAQRWADNPPPPPIAATGATGVTRYG